MSENLKRRGWATRLAHEGMNPFDCHGFVNPPIVRGSTVLFPDAETLREGKQPYTYGTHGTPTTRALCEIVNAMEGSDGTVLTSSGLSAVTLPMLALLSPGDHVLCTDSVYAPTRRFCRNVLKRMGVEVEFYAPSENASVQRRFRDNTRLLHLESPASNTFEVQDVAAMTAVAKERGILSSIDNTYATALLFRPMDHGVDIVMHAATKYPSGHSDVLMGFVSGSGETFRRIADYETATGSCVSSDDAALVLRGLRTMPLRLEQHGRSALAIATRLEKKAEVDQVLHPALPSHPTHELFERQFEAPSGLFAFTLRGGREEADKFLNALTLFGLGYSWAGFESLAVPVNLSDRTFAPDIGEGALIRLQIGLEDTDDLIADIDQALAAALG